jgi:hypothetical protein
LAWEQDASEAAGVQEEYMFGIPRGAWGRIAAVAWGRTRRGDAPPAGPLAMAYMAWFRWSWSWRTCTWPVACNFHCNLNPNWLLALCRRGVHLF